LVKLQRVYARMTWLDEAMKDGVSTDIFSGSRKQALIRKIPNGATQRRLYCVIFCPKFKIGQKKRHQEN